MKQKFYAIGVGPGDPKLMTLKAVELLKDCEIIGIPSKEKADCVAYKIASQAVPELEEKMILSVEVPMTKDANLLKEAYASGATAIIKYLSEGKSVAFLNLGDPTIYGSVQTLCDLIVDKGYEVEIINGVSSICAVASCVNIPLALREEGLHILPSNYEYSEQEIKEYLLKGDSVVLMKSSKKKEDVKAICVSLEKQGIARCYAVTDCGMETEIVWNSIDELDDRAGYFTTIIVKPCG